MTKKYTREFLDSLSDCIYWEGKLLTSGHGVLPNGRKAHEDIWEKVNGPIPADRIVRHTCNVRSCINISHLYLSKPGKLKVTKDFAELGRGRNRRTVVVHETRSFVKNTRTLKRIRLLDFTTEEIDELFYYKEGNLHWKKSGRGRTKDKAIGTKDRKIPIIACSVNGVRCGLHELVWILFNGQIDEDQRIIFKDGNALNCKIENLTLVNI